MCFSDSFALVAKTNGKIDKSLSKMIDAFVAEGGFGRLMWAESNILHPFSEIFHRIN